MKNKAILIPINLLIIMFLTVSISTIHIPSRAATQSSRLYLPLIVESTCAADGVINGGFEQDDFGWSISTTGIGPKIHDLIGSVFEGFSPYRGTYAARLGGYEGVSDTINQTITIPSQGRLSYWWKMGTYETLPYHDHFVVNLNQPDGTGVVNLANHTDADIEGVWQQDIFDLSAYAGGSYQIQFFAYNDNWYFTWFDIDEIHICGGG
jgi:hypothetical protein